MKLDLRQKTEGFSPTAERNNPIPSKGLEPKTCDFGDRVLELRMRGELIHALRKRKATDTYSRLEDLAKNPPDDI
jgi:hypothetical protein